MPDTSEAPLLPAQLGRARDGLSVLAALLTCIDPLKWDSLARPSATELGHLMFSLHGELLDGLDALGLSDA
jgi:hypothetical protein